MHVLVSDPCGFLDFWRWEFTWEYPDGIVNMAVGLSLNDHPALDSKGLTSFCSIVKRVSDLLLLRQSCYECLPYSPFLVLWFWLRLCNLSVGSVNWPLVVFIQRKRWRSLTVGNGSGVSACPPVVTVAWGHARALALELSANKPPRPRSVRFPATGRSNLEVSIALLRDLLWFLFWVWSRKPVICLVLQCLDEGARPVFQVHQR